MTHFEDLNIFQYFLRHIEVKEDCLKVVGPRVEVHMKSSSRSKKSHHRGGRGARCDDVDAPQAKKMKIEVKQRSPLKEAMWKRPHKPKKIEFMRYSNCGKKGHFANACPRLVRQVRRVRHVHLIDYLTELCVFSTIILSESCPMWILDSGSTYHIFKD